MGNERTISPEEVAKHKSPGDLWITIESDVYDLSRFANLHPGGKAVLFDPTVAGKDATEAFFSVHRSDVLEKPQFARLKIGTLLGNSRATANEVDKSDRLSKVPYAEPTWLLPEFKSPYYKQSHRELQRRMRVLVEEVLFPDGQLKEADGKRASQQVLDEMTRLNVHAMRLGPGKHLKGRVLMEGAVKPEEFDYFHELVITQELVLVGTRGYGDALLSGMVIGLPPVLNFGSEVIREQIVSDILNAKKVICLAISEPFAGSDVSGLRTTAVKSEDGKEWIINGTKKWITNGTYADYFVVGTRTDGGFTVILVPRVEGVETKPIKTSYSASAGTAYVTFDKVRVPVEYTLGEEDGGLYVLLSNFNHERWVLCCISARAQRLITEECFKWAYQRKAFGKRLIDQPVVRHKLATMMARCESVQNWLENVTHQMCCMSYHVQADKLAGQMGFLKMYCTQTAQKTAVDAVQIFGGRGITQSGMGRFIEHAYRTIAFDSILGGTEDVMGDLGVRQAMRNMPEDARL
ncbi:Very long-chain specific acyl-CoA dehydrogenase, mitochondrial [Rhizoctonia solani]|uniref:Very long-chain specific acyl-CoA dehydrogenase, mitochondrial n=1 Tax=Rhizoctonia solani TaxID=456999 RepID=A0A0K6FQT4_9AGAM|nr:Very long-chain specific acyl-CoA dehydrogenase, mitochondrial [Rhizoctonia solani]